MFFLCVAKDCYFNCIDCQSLFECDMCQYSCECDNSFTVQGCDLYREVFIWLTN